mmetsp:Transcript_17837/g.49445  ORF Transcript_17837/g.49445 Transcript_17837/m.49445 type:complete len:292 (-) Transcript_17837:243-1118(-)|eukprot:CAMPEP_0198132436 /NCGR_PEP_ID=MMETSP1442-20131203/58324_1 /TAXON_ID= /ORGANISM="Craspedostauros australis, Strain CCMP3328" /LENGTH=291 /DNA_ID=CAMNT_0043793441 /DNA_START=594 /DNA_END=1469 /DNA_ORIENTATION=+
MEEELLREMIRDRDAQITLIQRKVEDSDKKTARFTSELNELRAERTQTKGELEKEREQLLRRYRKLVEEHSQQKDQMDMKKQQAQAQGTTLHAYTEVMKTVATPESRDSSYVMRMQAQLCKAMHSMGMIENQLAMTNKHADQIQKFLKECNTGMVEEKSQVELKLMNDLVIQDNERREIETKHKGMMETFWSEKDALEQKIEDAQNRNANSDDEDEEDDEEEREELMEILTQGQEEIERMQAEVAKKIQQIKDLKVKAGDDSPDIDYEQLAAAASAGNDDSDASDDSDDDD